jgi:hypothetical protein
VFWVLILLGDIWLHTRHGLVDGNGEQLGRDFVNSWAGPRLALHGHAAAAYSIPDLTSFERSFTAPNAEPKFYSYPPVYMLLTFPLILTPFFYGYLAWTICGWAAVAALLSPQLGRLGAATAVLAFPAFFLNAYSGQNGAFTAAIMAGALILLDRRPGVAGVLFGVMCVKPQLAVLVPVALVAGARWRTTAAAAATTVLLCGATLAVFGWSPWEAFIRNAPFQQQLLATGSVIWRRLPTVFAALRLLGAPSAWAYGGQAVSAALAAAVVWRVWRSGASNPLKGATLLIATFLATPYAWDYDMVVLLFAALWWWRAALPEGPRRWELASMTAMVVAPAVTPLLATSTHVQAEPLALWFALALVSRRASASPFPNAGADAREAVLLGAD